MTPELTKRQIWWLRIMIQKNAVLYIIPPTNQELRDLAEMGLAAWSSTKAVWQITSEGRRAYASAPNVKYNPNDLIKL
jgi:hypothetical protein